MPDVLEAVPLGDNLIFGIIREMLKTSVKPAKKGEKEIFNSAAEQKKLLLGALIVALFLVVTTEPLKVILRKNIGKHALSMPGIIVAAILYILCAGVLFFFLVGANYGHTDISTFPIYFQYLFNQYILIAGILFYILFAGYIMVRGIDEVRWAKEEEQKMKENNAIDPLKFIYRGTCIIMGHMSEKGFHQFKIWSMAEPRACFKIGLILTVIHPLIGLPFLATSLSFWLNEWYHVHYKWIRLQDKYDRMNIEAQITNHYYNQNSQKPSSSDHVQ